MAVTWRKNYFRYKQYFLNVRALYGKRRDLKMFLELLLTFATMAIFGIFALKPTFSTVAGLIKDIRTKQDLIAQMDSKINNLQLAQQVFLQEQMRVSLLNQAIPAQAQPEGWVRQVEGMANSNGVQVLGISVNELTLLGEEKKRVIKKDELEAFPDGASNLGTSVSVSSSNYANITSFLSDIENLRRPIKIDSISVNSAVKETQQNLILLITGRVPFISVENQ